MPARTWPYLTFAAALLIAALLFEGQGSTSAQAAPDAKRGAAVFQRSCAICHSVGRGTVVGPDLLGVTRRRKHAWLVAMIQRPDSLLNRRDPIALALLKKYQVPMPDLKVSNADRDDLIAYFEVQTAARDKAAAAKNAGDAKADKPPE